MTADLVLRRKDGAIARLTLNDGARANVLSRAMIAELAAALAEASADPALRVIVLDAAGPVFCAGHDLAELRAEGVDHAALFAECSRLMMAIEASPKPVIAKVAGAAVAAGCQLVASCDLAFAAETARFGLSGIRLGLFCSTPAVAVARAVGARAAREMALTGRFVGAAEAAQLGLINRALPPADLGDVVEKAAAAIASRAPDAIALGKAAFRAQIGLPLADAYALTTEAMVENLALDCAKEGIDGFLAKAPSSGA